MKGKTEFETEKIISGSSAILDEFDPIIDAPSRIKVVSEKVCSPTEMIFDATVTIFFVAQNIVFKTEMIVTDVPTIISDSVKIIVFATKITSATKKIFFVTEKIFSDTLPGSEIQRPAGFAHREDLLREANDLLFGQKDLLRNEEDFLQARLDFLRLREDLLRNELLFLSYRRDHFVAEDHFRDDDTFLRDGEDLPRPGYEFLCGKNDVLCRRENRRRGAGGAGSKPSTIQLSLETRRTVYQLTLDQRRQPDSRPPRKIAPEPRARTRQTHRPHQVDIIDVDGVGHPQG